MDFFFGIWFRKFMATPWLQWYLGLRTGCSESSIILRGKYSSMNVLGSRTVLYLGKWSFSTIRAVSGGMSLEFKGEDCILNTRAHELPGHSVEYELSQTGHSHLWLRHLKARPNPVTLGSAFPFQHLGVLMDNMKWMDSNISIISFTSNSPW